MSLLGRFRDLALSAFACVNLPCLGDATALQTPASARSEPPYKSLRFDEDYRYLREPAMRGDFWDPVKYMPLGAGDSFLSLGGELRERFENYSAANFGVPGRTADGYLLHRVLLHADLHVGTYLRGFVQFGNHLAPGKTAAAPPYRDRLDVQQAFVDVRVPLSAEPNAAPVLRVGRQELAFGSQRLVSIRDAPNVRRVFDGVRVGGVIDQVRLDAFVTRPVLLRVGDFDDRSNRAQSFWGTYTTFPAGSLPGSGLDLYYLGFENKTALYSTGSGAERRHSVGARVFGAIQRWDWDWEALGQFGSFGPQRIRAWGFSSDTGYTFDLTEQKVRGGLKFTVGSGDRDPRDGKLGTYGGLFPKLAYFNQAGLLGASNVAVVQPSLTMRPGRGVKLTVACDFIWRATTSDAVYTAAAVPITGTAGRPGRYTGRQFSVDLSWQVDRHLVLSAGLVRANVAEVLSRAGGKDATFTYASVAYMF